MIDWQPYPTHVLPEPLRGFVTSGAESIGCDASYLALPLLTAVGAAIGTTRRLVLKRDWTVCPILWCAIVGESGTSKTPAFQLVMRHLEERQHDLRIRHLEAEERHEADVMRYERDLAQWKRSKGDSDAPTKPMPLVEERNIVSDTTVEALAPILAANPRGVLLARDELAGWIRSFDRYASKGGGDAPHWLSMYNGGSMLVDRKGQRKSIYVPTAAVAICGGIQPGILHRSLGDEHRQNGLASRLLLTCPPRQTKRWTENEIDETIETAIERMLGRLYDLQPDSTENGKPRPRLIGMTTEAKAVWIEQHDQHEAEQTDLCGDLAAAWSKLQEIRARLALILHYAQWQREQPDQVDANTMRRAVALTDWHKYETRRVYDQLGESEESADQRRLVEWIGRRGGTVTVRDVQMGCRWLRESGAAEAALANLIKGQYGTWQSVPSTDKGGRPTSVFQLAVSTKPPQTHEIRRFVDVDSVDDRKSQIDESDEWGEI